MVSQDSLLLACANNDKKWAGEIHYFFESTGLSNHTVLDKKKSQANSF